MKDIEQIKSDLIANAKAMMRPSASPQERQTLAIQRQALRAELEAAQAAQGEGS